MRAFTLFVLIASAALADGPSEPPSVVRLFRVPGNLNAIAPWRSSQVPVNVYGMAAMTGDAESWLLEMHDTFGSLEKVDRVGPDYPARSVMAVHRPAWGYHPDEAARLLPKARYVLVSIYTVRPGSEFDFNELARLRRTEFFMANSLRAEMAYQVVSGGATGVYMFFAPLPSLRLLDEGLLKPTVASEVYARAAKAAIANPDIIREQYLLRVDPSRSWLSDDFTAADSDFWRR